MTTAPKRCGTCRTPLRYKWADGTTAQHPVAGARPECSICLEMKGTRKMETNLVRLETREGNFVTEIVVPPFEPPADVLAWGVRVFIRVPELIVKDLPVYREGLLYAVPSS